MTHYLHTQVIGNELLYIIKTSWLGIINRATFVLTLVSANLPSQAQPLIPHKAMHTGNSQLNISNKQVLIFMLSLICLVWTPAYGQQLVQQDPLLPLYKLKKVKSITAWEQGATAGERTKAYYKEYNNNGNLTFELVYDESGEVVKKYQSFYNTSNKVLKEVWTQDETDSVIYKYKGDKLTEESWYWGADKSRTRVVHFFDSLDRKVCTVSKNNWGVYIDSFFYNNNQISLVKNYNENGQLTSLSEKEYDTKGRLILDVLKDEEGNLLQTNKKAFTELGPKYLETILYNTQTTSTETNILASMAESYKYDYLKQLKEITNNSYTNNELLINNKIIFIYGDQGLPSSQTTQNITNNTKQLLRFSYTFF